jgi:hypothetical protein
MPKGILYVESRPVPGQEDEYNTWYDETHLKEVVSLLGFVSARRFAPVDGQGPYVAIYEIDADDLPAAVAGLGEASARGELFISPAVSMDPPPTPRLLEVTKTYE